MNRGQIRDATKMLLNWDVFGTDLAFLDRINRCIDLAYHRVGNDCPEALVPDQERRAVPGTYASGAGSAVTSFISSTADAFVLEFTNSTGSSFTPRTDRTWDGKMHLEVTLANGEVVRYQCREFWTVAGGGVNSKYVSIDRPWGYGTATNLKYRLFCPYLWLRDDVERVIIGQRFGSTGNPLTMGNINTGIYHGEWSNQNDRQFGYPRELRREDHYQHPSPNLAPIPVITPEQGTWGPDPIGQFKYVYTNCWGYRDPARLSAQGSFIPEFESAPSPASAAVTVSSVNDVVVVTTPEIAWQLNYGDNLTLRYGKTGWYKRLYRARITTGAVPSHGTIEHPEVYQFLADIEDTATVFTDNGSRVPDYGLRLPEVHGFFGWSPWPLPTGEEGTHYDLKIQRRADGLRNDNDAPKIVPTCIDALTFYTCAYLARHDKDNETAELFEGKAKEVILGFRARIANPTGVVQREAWDGGQSPRGGWPRFTGSV